MSAKRFYAERIPLPGETLELSAAEAHHAVRVLRLGEGDRLMVLDGAGVVAMAGIVATDTRRRAMLVRCLVHERQTRTQARRVHLLVAPPRGKAMGVIVRQATELGVTHITPVLCRYGVAKPDADAACRTWRQEAVAAMKQSGNPFLPQVEVPTLFAAAVAEPANRGYVGAVPTGAWTEGVRVAPLSSAGAALWIGPEGGFSTEEVQALRQAGCRPLTVGAHILRVETAVPALLGMLIGMIDNDKLRSRCD